VIGDNAARATAAGRLRALGFGLPALVHPSTILGAGVVHGEGVVVMARAVIGPEARIGDLALINTGAIVEHDCVVGEAAHVAPGAILAGAVRVGARALVGAGASVRPGLRIGAGAVIGAGAAVTADTPARARGRRAGPADRVGPRRAPVQGDVQADRAAWTSPRPLFFKQIRASGRF
jgi:UDP-perosamine 4-acetyltransferase